MVQQRITHMSQKCWKGKWDIIAWLNPISVHRSDEIKLTEKSAWYFEVFYHVISDTIWHLVIPSFSTEFTYIYVTFLWYCIDSGKGSSNQHRMESFRTFQKMRCHTLFEQKSCSHVTTRHATVYANNPYLFYYRKIYAVSLYITQSKRSRLVTLSVRIEM